MHKSKHKNSVYLNNARIIKHLQDIAENNDFNRFVTVSFVYSKFGRPLNKTDVAMASRLMSAYFNKVSHKLNGRPRRGDSSQRRQVPAIGFPEYKSKNDGSGHLHYHALLRVSDDQLDFFNEITKKFWVKIIKNTIGFPPKIDNRGAYNPRGAAFYSNKYFEDGFTLENTVYAGISLT